MNEGHPVYFVIFYRDPEPGQTLADVCAAEAAFLREVQARHPRSPTPLVTGNCQGGWAAMMLAATHPDMTGPVVIAALRCPTGPAKRAAIRCATSAVSPAARWPALISDLGGGQFDGATSS